MTVRAETQVSLARVDDGAPGADGTMLYAICTTAAGTAAKVGTLTPAVAGFTLETGCMVTVNFSATNSSSSATFNLNGTGAYPVRWKDGTALTSTTRAYLAANRLVILQFDGTYWEITGATTDSNTYDRTQYKASLTATAAISAGVIGVLDSNSKIMKLTTTPFQVDGPILYIGTAYTATALTQTNNYTMWGSAFNLTNTKSGFSGTAGKPVFIKGTLSGRMFTPDAEIFTCTVPSAADSKVYILLGLMSTSTNAVLNAEHPMYAYGPNGFTQLGKVAEQKADAAQTTASAANITAGNAYSIATATQQHFWYNSTDSGAGEGAGAHITEVDKDTFIANPSAGGKNLYANSNGIAVRDGVTDLAVFGGSGATIGKASASHSTIDANGQRFYASDGTTQLANIGYGPGTDSGGGTTTAPYYSLGARYSGSAIGNYSVAEGNDNVASGYSSHAEGYITKATGGYSHAEGNYAESQGESSHAEGYLTKAKAKYSHAGGYGTVADQQCQTAIGSYNTQNNTDNLFVVGGGTQNVRADVFEVNKYGMVKAAGSITDGWGNSIPEIQTGEEAQVSVPANDKVDVNVSFSTPMNAVPTVIVSLISNSSAGGFGAVSAAVVLNSVTQNGFTCRLANKDTSSRVPAFSWVAIA